MRIPQTPAAIRHPHASPSAVHAFQLDSARATTPKATVALNAPIKYACHGRSSIAASYEKSESVAYNPVTNARSIASIWRHGEETPAAAVALEDGTQMKITINQDALNKIGKQAVAKVSPQVQMVVDDIYNRRASKSSAQIVSELRASLPGLKWSDGDRGTQTWADAIVEGHRIVIHPGDVN